MFLYFSQYCQPHPLPNYISFLTLTNCIKVSEMIDNVIIFNRGYPPITLIPHCSRDLTIHEEILYCFFLLHTQWAKVTLYINPSSREIHPRGHLSINSRQPNTFPESGILRSHTSSQPSKFMLTSSSSRAL